MFVKHGPIIVHRNVEVPLLDRATGVGPIHEDVRGPSVKHLFDLDLNLFVIVL